MGGNPRVAIKGKYTYSFFCFNLIDYVETMGEIRGLAV